MLVCVARLFNPGSRLSRVLKKIGIAEKLLLQLLIDLQELRLASSSSCCCSTTGIVVVVVSFSSLCSIHERGSGSQLSTSFSSSDRSCCTSRHCSAHALFNNATERKKERNKQQHFFLSFLATTTTTKPYKTKRQRRTKQVSLLQVSCTLRILRRGLHNIRRNKTQSKKEKQSSSSPCSSSSSSSSWSFSTVAFLFSPPLTSPFFFCHKLFFMSITSTDYNRFLAI